MTIRAAFFDVDGTIVDTEPRNRAAIEDVAAIGGHIIKKSDWDFLAGQGDCVIWEKICAETPSLKDVFNTASSFERACLNAKILRIQDVKPITESIDAIDMLKAGDVAVAAVSNAITGDGGASLQAAGLSLTDTFAFCLFRDDLRRLNLNAKPHPDPYLHAQRLMNAHFDPAQHPPLQASECLIIEDSRTGVLAGLAAGMHVIHLIDESGPLSPADLSAALAGAKNATYDPVARHDLVAACKKCIP